MSNRLLSMTLSLLLLSSVSANAQVSFEPPNKEEVDLLYKMQCQTEKFVEAAKAQGLDIKEENLTEAYEQSKNFNALLRDPKGEIEKMMNAPGDWNGFGVALMCGLVVSMEKQLTEQGCQDPSGQKADPTAAIALCKTLVKQ